MDSRAWKILLVEDEDSIRTVLRRVFELDGHAVISVEHAEAALPLIAAGRFDLVLTDKNLPGRDGVQLARMARDAMPTVAIVLMTGFASSESAAALVGAIDAYVTKPFDLRAFKRSLPEMIERRRRLAQRDASTPATAAVTVIEHDAHELSRLSRILRSLGCEVKLAQTAADLDRLSTPDAILIDTRIDDPQLTRALWRLQGMPTVPRVIAISPSQSVDGQVQAIAVAADAHLLLASSNADLTAQLHASLMPRPSLASAVG